MSSCCSAKKEEIVPSSFLSKLRLYRPLIIILDLSVVAAIAVSFSSGNAFMNLLMGFFLLFLSALKIFNVEGFAASFKQYDFLAKRTAFYAYSYPFIELGLGLLYLSGAFPIITNTIMLFVMLLGCVGITGAIKRGEKLQCACVGNVFNLPVGKVTLAENLVMASMAALNLVHLYF